MQLSVIGEGGEHLEATGLCPGCFILFMSIRWPDMVDAAEAAVAAGGFGPKDHGPYCSRGDCQRAPLVGVRLAREPGQVIELVSCPKCLRSLGDVLQAHNLGLLPSDEKMMDDISRN